MKVSNRNPKASGSLFFEMLRIILGLVFLFSSVVKGIDPVGTSYRVADYLQIYGWTAWVPYALWIAFLVIFSEFLLGTAFLLKVSVKTAATGMFLMLLFFLGVTWLDARYNMVPDCGCFGDAIKLTNWQTFYKNVVLIVLSGFFLWNILKQKQPPKATAFSWFFLFVLGGGFLWFMFYNLNHLPVIDFRNWKTGRDMSETRQKPKTFVTYRNKKTGEEKTFVFPDYPWKDTAWMARWEFVSQKTWQPSSSLKYHLIIEDSLGNDRTKFLVENPGYQFFLIAFDLAEANVKGLKKAAVLSDYLRKKGVSMVLLTATPFRTARQMEKRLGLFAPVYQSDETDLKAMIRSNPGLMLLHHGVVLKKWHYHDFPDTIRINKILK